MGFTWFHFTCDQLPDRMTVNPAPCSDGSVATSQGSLDRKPRKALLTKHFARHNHIPTMPRQKGVLRKSLVVVVDVLVVFYDGYPGISACSTYFLLREEVMALKHLETTERGRAKNRKISGFTPSFPGLEQLGAVP